MKEIRDLATSLRDSVAAVRKASADAKDGLESEVARAQVNVQKVGSMTNDLKTANLEVEAFLGDSGSNFSPSGTVSNTPPQVGHTDRNGVTVNEENLK